MTPHVRPSRLVRALGLIVVALMVVGIAGRVSLSGRHGPQVATDRRIRLLAPHQPLSPTASTTPPGPPSHDAPQCPAADLRALPGPEHALAGAYYYTVYLKNIGGTTCSLSNYPEAVQAFAANGELLHPQLADTPDGFHPSVLPANLRPGGTGALFIGAVHDCGTYGIAVSRLVFTIDDGTVAVGAPPHQPRDDNELSDFYAFPCGTGEISPLGVQSP